MGYKDESTTRWANTIDGDQAAAVVIASTEFPIQRKILDVWVIPVGALVDCDGVDGIFDIWNGAVTIGSLTIVDSGAGASIGIAIPMVWAAGQIRGQFLPPNVQLTMDVNTQPTDAGPVIMAFDIYVRSSH